MDNSTNDPCYTFLDPITGETMTFTVTWQTPLESPLLGSASYSETMETEHREPEQSLVQPCDSITNLSPLGPPSLNVTLQQSLNSPTSPMGSLDPDHTMMDGGQRELEQEQPLAETMDPSIGPSYTVDRSGQVFALRAGAMELSAYWGPVDGHPRLAVEVGPHIIILIEL